jgi:hypothetical protein
MTTDVSRQPVDVERLGQHGGEARVLDTGQVLRIVVRRHGQDDGARAVGALAQQRNDLVEVADSEIDVDEGDVRSHLGDDLLALRHRGRLEHAQASGHQHSRDETSRGRVGVDVENRGIHCRCLPSRLAVSGTHEATGAGAAWRSSTNATSSGLVVWKVR